MRLIDRDTCKLSLLVNDAKVFSEVVKLAILWRDVKEACMRVATLEVFQDGSFDRMRCRTVYRSDVYARGAQGSDLVVHQCQQRRDDNGDAEVDNSRELKTQALAETGSSL